MEQIKTGGPVTVTDPEMKRYFMTIPEACSLVLKTGGVGKNGFSYLLDMGEPIRIVDIAEQIIKFSGFEPHKDIEIKFIGPRKGERLDEPLWTAEENPQETEYPKILQLKSIEFEEKKLQDLLQILKPVCFCNSMNSNLFRNKEYLLNKLTELIPSYNGAING